MASNPPGYMGDYYHKNKQKFNNPKEIKKRVERNKARALFEKNVGSAAIAGKDIDHVKSLKHGGKTVLSNLRAISPKKNRARKN